MCRRPAQEHAQDHKLDGPGEESDIAHRIHHPGCLQFDQGYANNGPVTAAVRSHTSAHKIRSQIAWAKNRNWFAEASSSRMTVPSPSRSPAVRNTLPVP